MRDLRRAPLMAWAAFTARSTPTKSARFKWQKAIETAQARASLWLRIANSRGPSATLHQRVRLDCPDETGNAFQPSWIQRGSSEERACSTLGGEHKPNWG